MGKKLTTQDFIKKSNKKHGIGKFGYDRVKYDGYENEVEIYCYDHEGYFFQKASNHLHGNGCNECALDKSIKNRTKTTEEFIEESTNLHGNKFDYSKVIYKGNKKYVIIICNICGYEFKQIPVSHLKGHGCPKCAGNIKRTKEEFIVLGQIIHVKLDNTPKYGYDNVIYIDRNTPVEIMCFICNESFFQRPHNHIQQKQGCPPCSGNVRKTTEDYIDQALYVHTINKYCPYYYDECEYINNKNDVKIWCIKCKRYFYQNADSHLRGHGCSTCSKYKTEQFGRYYLEEITDLKFDKCRPDFTKTDKYKLGLELDCFNKDYKIAIEFDGIQHSKFEPFFHATEDDFKKQQERDNDKNKLCKDNNITLIRIPHQYNFKNKNKLFNYLFDQLENCGFIKQLEQERNVLILPILNSYL